MADSYGRIFLLSHMRAYTTLAGHVLGSHPEIDGYYEMHLSYEEPAALDLQRARFLRHDAWKPGSRWLFDKLLHDQYVVAPERLHGVELKLLLCLREPITTVSSIVELFRDRPAPQPWATAAGAAAYYVQRLTTLADFAARHPRRYYYFDAELWPRAPERLLAGLARWLGLATPLSERYRIFSQTGRRGKGDSSARIHSGCIDRTQRDPSAARIPRSLVEETRRVYLDTRHCLLTHAADVLTWES